MWRPVCRLGSDRSPAALALLSKQPLELLWTWEHGQMQAGPLSSLISLCLTLPTQTSGPARLGLQYECTHVWEGPHWPIKDPLTPSLAS